MGKLIINVQKPAFKKSQTKAIKQVFSLTELLQGNSFFAKDEKRGQLKCRRNSLKEGQAVHHARAWLKWEGLHERQLLRSQII